MPKYIPKHNVKGGRPVRLLEDIYEYELPDWHMPRYYNEDRQARATRPNKLRVYRERERERETREEGKERGRDGEEEERECRGRDGGEGEMVGATSL